ncbi:MAG: PAS domain S-box protein [Deltaproteobacteria bacterium]
MTGKDKGKKSKLPGKKAERKVETEDTGSRKHREQKRAEKELQESKKRFRGLVDASSEVLYRMSPDWSEMRQLHSRGFLTETEEPSRTWLREYIHPDDQPHVMEAIYEAIQNKSIFELEHRVFRKDGTLGWTFSRAVPILDENGEIAEWFGGASDITARKSAQDALRRSEDGFRAIVSSTPDHVLVQDRDLRYTMVINPQLGLTEEDMIGKTDFDILVKEDAEKLTPIKRQVLETGKPVYVESQAISKDGKPEFFEGSYVPKFDAEGQCDGLIGYFRNVTERKQVEKALRESEGRLSAIFQSAEEAIVTLDKEQRFLRANPASGVITGVPHDQLIGRSLSEFVDPSFNLSSAWEDFVRSGRFKGEVPIRHSSGSLHIVEASGNANIAPGRHLFVGHDITERKRMEEELRRSRDELELRVKERTTELERTNKELAGEIEKRKKFEEGLKASANKIIEQHEQRKYLARRLVDLLEKDRRDIALMLHDEIGQILTAVKMDLEIIETKLESNSILERLKRVKERTSDIFAIIKNVSGNLRPSLMDHLGLIPSVRALIRETEEYANFHVRFYTKGLNDRLEPEKELALFRILQEALTNVARHSKAEQVFENLIRRDANVVLTVEDDGKGFDYNLLGKLRQTKDGPVGITIMRERAAEFGGSLRIDSQPGKGTYLMAEIPV